jgi:HEPN domain-containing protein
LDSDEAEFNKLMELIDAELSERHVPISQRPWLAFDKVIAARPSFPLVIGFDLLSPPGDPKSELLEDRIQRWYETRYGDKLSVDISQGTFVLFIRGAVFEGCVPLVYGEIVIFCAVGEHDAPDLLPELGWQINALDHIKLIAPGLRTSLTEDECANILEQFMRAYRAFCAVTPLQSIQLVRAALRDHRIAVDNLVASFPHAGISRWHSLQAIEKLLKAFLASRGQEYDKVHKLAGLAQSAEKHGLPAFDPSFIDAIQCTADVRYGESHVTIESALAAHHAALELTLVIAIALSHSVANSE